MNRILSAVFALLLLAAAPAHAAGDKSYESATLARSGSSWDGAALPAYPQGAPEILIVRIRIEPGARLPMHKHPYINAGVLLSGELTVVTEDDKVLRMKAGDALIEVVDKWHYGRNEGSEPAEIVVFYAGERGSPVTVIKP